MMIWKQSIIQSIEETKSRSGDSGDMKTGDGGLPSLTF